MEDVQGHSKIATATREKNHLRLLMNFTFRGNCDLLYADAQPRFDKYFNEVNINVTSMHSSTIPSILPVETAGKRKQSGKLEGRFCNPCHNLEKK